MAKMIFIPKGTDSFKINKLDKSSKYKRNFKYSVYLNCILFSIIILLIIKLI